MPKIIKFQDIKTKEDLFELSVLKRLNKVQLYALVQEIGQELYDRAKKEWQMEQLRKKEGGEDL